MTEKDLWTLLNKWLPGHKQRLESTTEPGIPDVNVCWQGREVWLELKTNRVKKDGQPSVRNVQRAWHLRRIRQCGHVLVVVLDRGTLSVFRAVENNEVGIRYISLLVRPLPLKSSDWEWLINTIFYN